MISFLTHRIRLMHLVVSALSMFFAFQLEGLHTYRYSTKIDEAYCHIIALRFNQGQQILNEIKNSEPDNLLVYHIENYIDFFKTFIGEESNDYQTFQNNLKTRIEQLKKGDQSSPYYLYTLAEVKLQRALLRLKFQEYIKAGLEINQSYKLLKKNQRAFPDFALNNKSLAIIHSLIGSIKGVKKSLIKLFTSLDGNTKKGILEIDDIYYKSLSKNASFQAEIIGIRSLMALHVENNFDKAARILETKQASQFQGPLFSFIRASLKRHAGDNEGVLTVLDTTYSNQHYPFHYLSLIRGSAKLQKLDTTAREDILSFVNHFKGRNYIKDAYQKLGWYELLINERPDRYEQLMGLCEKYGSDIAGEDQQALHEAKSRSYPHVQLLKSRLLFDGGYYRKASTVLNSVDPSSLSNSHFLEYTYRMARIMHKTDNYTEAVKLYGSTINIGRESPDYFACNSALQTGIIFMELNEDSRAKHYFNLCLKIRPKQHRHSLHQKAILWKEKLSEEGSLE